MCKVRNTRVGLAWADLRRLLAMYLYLYVYRNRKQAISKESCRCAAEVARIAKKLHSDAMASCLK